MKLILFIAVFPVCFLVINGLLKVLFRPETEEMNFFLTYASLMGAGSWGIVLCKIINDTL